MGKYERKKKKSSPVILALTILLSLGSLALMGRGALWGLEHIGVPGTSAQSQGVSLAGMDRYDMYITNALSSALDGIMDIEKVYWLRDSDTIAPEPDPEKFGTAKDPAQLAPILDQAQTLLDGQKTLFTPETVLHAGSEITYYLDETILCITWKQVMHNAVYTISEVKIAHPSQLRRFVADGVYGSDKQYFTTEMAITVNAVTASSGDFYKFRPYGISVYNGEVYRTDSRVDTCFITGSGEMLFARKGSLKGEEAIKAYVKENDVRFSLAFGPVLIDNFELQEVDGDYPIGEVKNRYPRAAICYMGELHYLLVAANQEEPLKGVPDIETFAQALHTFGCEKAYTLDGGQTAVIVTNDQLINRPSYGYQRTISDIVYFATAIPDGGGENG